MYFCRVRGAIQWWNEFEKFIVGLIKLHNVLFSEKPIDNKNGSPEDQIKCTVKKDCNQMKGVKYFASGWC